MTGEAPEKSDKHIRIRQRRGRGGGLDGGREWESNRFFGILTAKIRMPGVWSGKKSVAVVRICEKRVAGECLASRAVAARRNIRGLVSGRSSVGGQGS